VQITNVSIAATTCQHIEITLTVAGQQRTIKATRDELTATNIEEIRAAVLARLRSFQLENNYTFAQVRQNLGGKVFEV
jgi:hypothetical protein